MRQLRVLPRADADVDEAADHYADRASLEVGLRFLSALEEAYGFIREHPEAGPSALYRREPLRGLRRWPVPGFESYLVFYRVTDDAVEVVRVLHGARDIEALFADEP